MSREAHFYHSFPRRGRATDAESAKGLAILSSICSRGLLLTPEVTEWAESLENGEKGPTLRIFQKRVCFTELQPEELRDHATLFGSFAIEFTASALRDMGALPVFYLPTPGGTDDGLQGLAAAFVARLSEIQELLDRLNSLHELIGVDRKPGDLVKVVRNGEIVEELGSVRELRSVAEYLSVSQAGPGGLLNALRALAGVFYPIENLQYTDELGYYRQREWRVIANVVKNGVRQSRELDTKEKLTIEAIDPEFFGKECTFPTGLYRRIDQCQVFPGVGSRSVLSFATKILVPSAAELEPAKHLLRQANIEVAVEMLHPPN